MDSDRRISAEQRYYEDDRIWNQALDNDPDEADRFSLIGDFIPDNTRSVLDVGCGNGDFLRSLEGRYERICGVDRSASALKYVSVEKHQASAENLPFADREFDTVCCLEVIEHLPMNLFQSVLEELGRVAARNIVISVPFDENTRADLVTCPGCFCSFNRNYHLRSFGKQTICSLLDDIDGGFEIERVETVGIAVHPVGLMQVKRLISPFQKPRLPAGAVCPQCGFSADTNLSSGSCGASESKGRPSGSVIRRILPKSRKPRWIAGLYVRNSNNR